jgi:hypothetical protein
VENKNDRKPPGQTRPAAPPAPKKRFRVEKIEERIAPDRGGGGYHNSGASGSCAYGCSIY